MIVLGIESSCDETAVGIVKNGREVLSSVINSQIEIHKKFGGVVPEVASRNHSIAISDCVAKALDEGGISLSEVDAIAVTFAPGLIGALLVGVNFAKGLAYSAGKPLVPVHHIKAHIGANYLAYKELSPPFLCLVASGGHSHIIEVSDYTTFSVIGRTRDDAAGEAFDKVARVLSLPYPGGVHIDRLAQIGNKNAIKFPKVSFKDAPFDFSFSGVKTSVINYVHTKTQKGEEIVKEDVAASFNEAVAGVLAEKLLRCAQTRGINKIAIAGGVSANTILREKMEQMAAEHNLELFLPPLSLCGDNGVMIAAQGYFEFMAGKRATLSLNGVASLPVDADEDNFI